MIRRSAKHARDDAALKTETEGMTKDLMAGSRSSRLGPWAQARDGGALAERRGCRDPDLMDRAGKLWRGTDLTRSQDRRHGGRVAAVSGNIGDKAAVAKMKGDRGQAWAGRHSCSAPAAAWRGGRKPDPTTRSAFRSRTSGLTENNLYGTILVCQAFVPPMVVGSGSVINIGSTRRNSG